MGSQGRSTRPVEGRLIRTRSPADVEIRAAARGTCASRGARARAPSSADHTSARADFPLRVSASSPDGPSGNLQAPWSGVGHWLLIKPTWQPEHAGSDETLSALARGSPGVRGGFGEPINSTWARFVGGAWEQAPIDCHERHSESARTTYTRLLTRRGCQPLHVRAGAAADGPQERSLPLGHQVPFCCRSAAGSGGGDAGSAGRQSDSALASASRSAGERAERMEIGALF